MPTVERLITQGTRRGERALLMLGEEYRDKRVAVGLSQQRVAGAAGISRSSYIRIERGRMDRLSIVTASRIAAVLGLDLSVRSYPGPNPMRDAAHAERLARVLRHVRPPLTCQLEAPLRQHEGRPFEQRAWDAVAQSLGRRTAFEMEMRLRDGQALERRIELKRRDDPVDSLVLLVADTKSNRQVLRENPTLFASLARMTIGSVTRMLREGHHPPSALVLV